MGSQELGVDWLCVREATPLHEVLRRQAGAADHGQPAGIVLVLDAEGRLQGTVTDGDVRRAILRHASLEILAGDAMNRDPIVFAEGLSFRAILLALPAELERRGRRSRRFLGKLVLTDEARRPTRVLDYHQLWEQRVATHRHIVVIGLGYVGLTLALELAKEGFQVTGLDSDRARMDALARGESYVHELGLPELLREQLARNFSVQSEIPEGGDVFVISVGTPVTEDSPSGIPVPRLAALREATHRVGRRLTRGGLVILRSTVPVGATREVVLPILEEESGLRGGFDFHLAFAPERTLEGNALSELRSLPQIVGGLNDDSVEATAALFRELTPTMVRMDSLEAAEMAKLVNNAYRDLIFAFANHMAQVAAPFNLDVAEVIRAANRGYPRDPVPLPSPGVGGPCLTKDPYILASVAARAGMPAVTLFQHGRQINESMHDFVVDAVVAELIKSGRNPKDCRILVCGLAFKGHPETGDLRNSSSLEIARRFAGRVGRVLGHDPVASLADIAAEGLEPVFLPEGLKDVDALLLLNNHHFYQKLDVFTVVRALRQPAIVYDGWHHFRAEDVLSACPSVYMGLGFVRSSWPGKAD